MESLPCTPQPTLSHELRTIINQRNILTARSKVKVLNALDKQIEENKAKHDVVLRSKVLEEIYTSEISYLHQLELIIKYFKEPLESSNLMSLSTRRSLFGNVESIYKVNSELLNQLKIQRSNVGAAFLYMAPFFKLYSMYAYGYRNAQDLPKHNAKLTSWLKSQESRPEVCSKLSALLIAPIQRLPRYRLLLRQLLSLTPSTHPHYSTLLVALKEVEKATVHINSLVFEQETHARLVTLQRCLTKSKPSIVAPNRKLIKEGILMKMSANGEKAQMRYFILLTDRILYCKILSKDRFKPPEEPRSLHCCCVFPISKCSVESVLGQGVFKLTYRSETLILFSEHKDDSLEWITQIQNTMSEYEKNKNTLHKKSSSILLTRKRKCSIENNLTCDENIPPKKTKMQHMDVQEGAQRNSYVKTVKSLFQTFGEMVREFVYPGNAR